MYNLKIKNPDTQVTIRNSRVKYIIDIISTYSKLGNFSFQVWSDEDPETNLTITIENLTRGIMPIIITCNRTFKLEYINGSKNNSNK